MKTNILRIIGTFCILVLITILLISCDNPVIPTLANQPELPIEFTFSTPQGTSVTELLGGGIKFLGSEPAGEVYDGARDEDANLVVVRFNGRDNFFSLKGFDFEQLEKVVCNVECDLEIDVAEGGDLMIVVNEINPLTTLAEPEVVWEKTMLPTPMPGTCELINFVKGNTAIAQRPLKMRSGAEIPEIFNGNVISYTEAGAEVEVLEDSNSTWVHIKNASGKKGWSKQCTQELGRLLTPK